MLIYTIVLSHPVVESFLRIITRLPAEKLSATSSEVAQPDQEVTMSSTETGYPSGIPPEWPHDAVWDTMSDPVTRVPARATPIPVITPTTVYQQHWASKRRRLPTWLIILGMVALFTAGWLVHGHSGSAKPAATPATSTQTLSTATFNRGAWQQAVDARLAAFAGNTANQLSTITYQYCALETSSVGIPSGLGRQQLVGAAQWLNDKYTELAVLAKPVPAPGLLADVKAYCGSAGCLLTP